jgi:hypothetical protein
MPAPSGHTAGLVDIYGAFHGDDLMAAVLQPGTRRDGGEEYDSETPVVLQKEARPSVSSRSIPVVAEMIDLFAGGDAVVDLNRHAIFQQYVNRPSTAIAKVEDSEPDMRPGFGPMSESALGDQYLLDAEIDEVFLDLFDPVSEFELFA